MKPVLFDPRLVLRADGDASDGVLQLLSQTICRVTSQAHRRHINPYTLARLRKLGCDTERLRVLEGFGAARCFVSL
jgi:hypothetical protein